MPAQDRRQLSVNTIVTRTPDVLDGVNSRLPEWAASSTTAVDTMPCPISSPLPDPAVTAQAVLYLYPLCEHVSKSEPKRINHLDHQHPDW